MKKIPVIEIFGPTIQGEGAVIGRKTMFIRTAGCDYSCSWCDSAFTWDGTGKNEIKQMTPQEIWAELLQVGGENFSHVTISGGNPLLYEQLQGLIAILKENGIAIAVETQGSRWQDWLVDIDDITISPKPPSSRMRPDFERIDSIVERLLDADCARNLSLKVVVFDRDDFEFAKRIKQRYPSVPFYVQVGNVSTSERDQDLLTKELIQKYEELIGLVVSSKEMNDAFVLPQLHTLVWGNKRGV